MYLFPGDKTGIITRQYYDEIIKIDALTHINSTQTL
jgi:hypothetical protein